MYLLRCQHKETENFYNSAKKKKKKSNDLIKKWINTMWCIYTREYHSVLNEQAESYHSDICYKEDDPLEHYAK